MRQLWPDGAGEFARWLRDNVDVLNDLTGLSLLLEQGDLAVGDSIVGLKGIDQSSGRVAIVATQVHDSDHGHLEQLISHATTAGAETVVWVATGFRPEHHAALDWLNSRTAESTRLFAVTARVVRIGDSDPAPDFELHAHPHDWAKPSHRASSSEPPEVLPRQGGRFERFWDQAWARLRQDRPSWPPLRAPVSTSWLDTDSELDGAALLMLFRSGDLEFQVFFGDVDERLNSARFAALRSVAADFEAAVGVPLEWDPMEGRKTARVSTRSGRGFVVADEDRWPEMTDWLVDMQRRFRAGLSKVGWPQEFLGIGVGSAAPGGTPGRRRKDVPV